MFYGLDHRYRNKSMLLVRSSPACIDLSRCLWSTMIMKRDRLLYEENKYKNLEILVLKKRYGTPHYLINKCKMKDLQMQNRLNSRQTNFKILDHCRKFYYVFSYVTAHSQTMHFTFIVPDKAASCTLFRKWSFL